MQKSWFRRALLLALVSSVGFGCGAEGDLIGGPSSPKAPAPAEILSFTATPAHVGPGDAAILNWKTSGAETITITIVGGDETLLDQSTETQGSLEVRPAETTTFELLAIGEDSEAQASVTVEVRGPEVQPPTIERFAADRSVVTDGVETQLTASWAISGATGLVLLLDGVDVALGERSIEEDSIELTISKASLLRLEATNEAGTTSAEITIDGVDAPRIERFLALPSRVSTGESYTLYWQTSGASEVELQEIDGELLNVGEDGELERVAAAEARWVVRAANPAGDVVEEELVVTLGSPLIVFAAFDEARGVPGAPLTLRWEIEGGTSLRLLDADGEEVDGCSTADLQSVAAGSCTFTSPAEVGEYEYKLEVHSPSQSTSETVRILVADGPFITHFDANPKELVLGDSVIFSWRVESDLEGNAPSIQITDADGAPVEGIEEGDGLEGSLQAVLSTPGLQRFLLEATTAGTTPARAMVEVLVQGIGAVALSATPGEIDLDVGEEAELSWQSENAVSLEIWELDEEGNPIEPALVDTDEPAAVSAGSLIVTPWHSTNYLARVVDGRGVESFDELEIRVLLVEIESFEANPTAVIEGELSLLSWRTKRADSVSLDFDATFIFEQNKTPMLDLEESGKELALEGNCGAKEGPEEESCPSVEIEGFSYPWAGSLFNQMRVSVNGFITFDEGEFGPSSRNDTFPPRTVRLETMHAVLWENLVAHPRESRILYAGGSEERGKYFAVSWLDFHLLGTREPMECKIKRSFQLILWEDGGFEYRYGDVEDGTGIRECVESTATVGYLGGPGGEHHALFYNSQPAGGFSGNAFQFRPFSIDLNMDDLPVVVDQTRSFTLTAYGARDSVVTKTVTVVAEPLASFTSVRTDGRPLAVSEPFSIEWYTEHAQTVEVRDPSGAVICPSSENNPVFGACETSWGQEGDAEFQVIATNAVGYESSYRLLLRFAAAPPKINLELTPDRIAPGDSRTVTLTWNNTNASNLYIYRDGKRVLYQSNPSNKPLVEDPDAKLAPGSGVASGSMTFEVEYSQTFRVEANNLSESVRVEFETMESLDAESDVLQIETGGEATISWTGKGEGGETPYATLQPTDLELVEVSGPEHAFVDISGIGEPIAGFAANPDRGNLVTLDLPFRFLYFGRGYEKIWVGSTGFTGFTQMINWGVVYPVLEWQASGEERPHITPYWGPLRSYQHGRGFSHFLPDPGNSANDAFIIQWDRMQIQSNPIPAPADQKDDLTFQLVLFRDGSFEFRYKTMSSVRYPNRAKGEGSAIGYRNTGNNRVNRGHELYYNPTNPVTLDGRTWRYHSYGLAGSTTVRPTESTVYRLCVGIQGDERCEDVPVAVLKQGELVFTELHPGGSATSSEQWIELRNVGVAPIDLEGMKLVSKSGSATIEGPAVIPAGGFAILAPSGVSFDPTVTVGRFDGSKVNLGRGADFVRLFSEADTLLAEVEWDEDWSFPTSGGLSLDSLHHRHKTLSVDDFSLWCETDDAGSPGSGESCASPYYAFDPFSDGEFIDILGTGASIRGVIESTLTEVATIPGGLGFEMPFFDETVSNIWASRHGFVSFAGIPEGRNGNDPLPTGWDTGMVAPFWDGFSAQFSSARMDSHLLYERRTIDGQQVLIVQWEDLRRHTTSSGNEWPGSATFQVQLWESGDIVFAYGTLLGNDRHFGSRATVGLESLDGTQGLLHMHNQAILRPGQAMKFQHKGP